MKYLHEFYLLSKLIEITGNLEFSFLIFLDVGLVISNCTSSDLTSLTSVYPMYKSTKPAAARVKKRHTVSSLIITRISSLPSCNKHPKLSTKAFSQPTFPLPWPSISCVFLSSTLSSSQEEMRRAAGDWKTAKSPAVPVYLPRSFHSSQVTLPSRLPGCLQG